VPKVGFSILETRRKCSYAPNDGGLYKKYPGEGAGIRSQKLEVMYDD